MTLRPVQRRTITKSQARTAAGGQLELRSWHCHKLEHPCRESEAARSCWKCTVTTTSSRRPPGATLFRLGLALGRETVPYCVREVHADAKDCSLPWVTVQLFRGVESVEEPCDQAVTFEMQPFLRRLRKTAFKVPESQRTLSAGRPSKLPRPQVQETVLVKWGFAASEEGLQEANALAPTHPPQGPLLCPWTVTASERVLSAAPAR